jgi:hypothetical protein
MGERAVIARHGRLNIEQPMFTVVPAINPMMRRPSGDCHRERPNTVFPTLSATVQAPTLANHLTTIGG